ncbi:MAG TPA: BatD family protein [Planctomycetota bacterium]|nr:BatD family protein [Planctomycetota bacterium]
MLRILCLALFCAFAPLASAQGNAAGKARLSTGLAKVGESPNVRLSVENAGSARIVALPKVDGLELGPPSAPQRSSFMESRGGRTITSSSIQWIIPIQLSEAGEFTIPPLRVEIDGAVQDIPVIPGTLKVVKDLDAAKLGLFEIEGKPDHVYEGQPFTLELRLGWVKRLAVEKASLSLPWWNNQSGVLEVAGPGFQTRGAQAIRLLVNGRSEVPFEAQGEEVIDGETFVVFSHKMTVLATRSGTLEYPTSTFLFAEVLERSGSPFRGSRMREYYATLDPFTIDVLPVPEAGRPFEWTGAVGALKAERRANTQDVTAGDTIQLEVTWSVMANTEFFDAPDLKRNPDFSGFRVLGTEESQLGMERRVVYELVPLSSEVHEIPSVPLWTFNPDTEAFELVKTDPVAIRVQDGNALDLSKAFGDGTQKEDRIDLRDVQAVPLGAGSRGIGGGWIGALALSSFGGWWFLRGAVRRHGDPASAEARARRRAAAQLPKDLAASTSPVASTAAVHRYLAARSGETAEAWIGRDVVEWGRVQGLGEPALDRLRELQRVLDQLDEAAFASGVSAPDRNRILAAASALQKEGVL